MKTLILYISCVLLFASSGDSMTPLVNFSHLNHLTERIHLGGDSVSIVHIYANYPSYKWVDAKESGPEGIACVDDAARAAIVLLHFYELTKDETMLRHARSLCLFVMKMQAEDGRFYNFIFADHSINRTGQTSYKSFGWWASRAVWCLSAASRILHEKDPAFAAKCLAAVERALPYVDTVLVSYDNIVMRSGMKVPQWLLYSSGADATSELLLGLIDYERVSHDEHVRSQIRKLAEGLVLMQDGDWKKFPYGLHRSWETMWHMWGNGQTEALASAALYLDMPGLKRSAELEAKCTYSRLLIHGMMKEMDVAKPAKASAYEQIAYGVRPMAVGLVRLFELTNDSIYLKMAGLAASWFFGNNALQQTMYDSSTGRCYDGLRDSATVNKNSGAESTIEALAVMIELSHYPASEKYLDYRRTDAYVIDSEDIGVFTHKDGTPAVFTLDTDKKALRWLEGKTAEAFLKSHPRPAH